MEPPAQTKIEPPPDAIREELRHVYDGYLFTRRRHPLLIEIFAEGTRLEALVREKQGNSLAFDHPLLHMSRDTYDMLVIHMGSLRDRLTKQGGVFELLKLQPERLRPATVDECLVDRTGFYGGATPEHSRRLKANFEQEEAQKDADNINAALQRLMQGQPPSLETVTALISRFLNETYPLDQHRNRVSAHAFEKGANPHLFLDLEELKEQLDIFERYLSDLRLVLLRKASNYGLRYANSGPDIAANDLADIIVHGSINRAVRCYGMPSREGDPAIYNYRQARELYFEPSAEKGK